MEANTGVLILHDMTARIKLCGFSFLFRFCYDTAFGMTRMEKTRQKDDALLRVVSADTSSTYQIG